MCLDLLLCLAVRFGTVPCFTHKAMRVTSKTRNWLDTAWQQPRQFQVQRSMTVHFHNRHQWPNDPFPFDMFLLRLLRLCLDACIWIFLNNVWSLVVRGMTSVRSLQVFVSSTIIAFVGNGSNIAAIFIRCLNCLKELTCSDLERKKERKKRKRKKKKRKEKTTTKICFYYFCYLSQDSFYLPANVIKNLKQKWLLTF